MAVRLGYVIDRSGSMARLVEDTIGGYNTYLDQQKALDGEAYLTTVIFDTDYEVVQENVDIRYVEHLTDKVYFARGATALLDAIGRAIGSIGATVKDGDNVLITVVTDGLENASHEFTNKSLKELVEKKRAEGWEFIFLGANIDSYAVGESMGMNHSFNYSASGVGTQAVYKSMAQVTSHYRQTGAGGGGGAVLDTEVLTTLNEQ